MVEYVALRATHPSWLTMSLPTEVATALRLRKDPEGGAERGRSISFLARGSGILRVVSTSALREALAVETLRHRLIATARMTDKLLLTLPAQVAQYLRLELVARPSGVRGTDDSLLWLTPAAEYYESRRAPSGRKTPSPEGSASPHVYLLKSLFPLPKELTGLAELEDRIEQEEWRPAVETLQRVTRGRRSGV